MKGLNNKAQYTQNQYYIKYAKQKLRIRKKYEDKINFGNESTDSIKLWNDNTRKLYQKYLKDIGDLLMKPDGNFQKFIWDIRSENDKLIQERQAMGRKSSPYNY